MTSRRLVSFAIGLYVVFAVCTCAQAQPQKSLEKILQHKIDSVRDTLKIPAIAFSAVLPSGALVSVASGMDPTDRMLLGSTGKTFFAALALRYVNEGWIALDDKVSAYLGAKLWYERIANADDITVRMLMEHTTGIEEYYPLGDFTERLRTQPDKEWTPEERIAYVLDREPLFPTGTAWSYADTNYLLLGLVLEAVTGKNAYSVIDSLFIKPLRLINTEPSVKRSFTRFVHGMTTANNPFGIKDSMVVNNTLVINPQMEWAGGGFISSTGDLARWARSYYHGEDLAETLRAEHLAGVPAKTGRDHRYGLGIMIRPSVMGFSYGHGGWFPGYLTEMDYFPDIDISACVQIATDDFRKLKRHPRGFQLFFVEEVIKELNRAGYVDR